MQEVPLSQLCESMSFSAAKLYNVFVTLIVFQLLLFLTLDFTLCSKQHVVRAQDRPLPCTDESVNGYVQKWTQHIQTWTWWPKRLLL